MTERASVTVEVVAADVMPRRTGGPSPPDRRPMVSDATEIAVTGRRGADTPYAALDAVAETEVGAAMLWVTAFGLVH
ncbi:MAG TPA: hypothetical protein VIG79_03815 [Lapillicoccus sp.]|jgi:hypothetical protein|uniref:hypothetical protein n=1 Tax=Lapillicoccus sp. TaxID=1909287 RepID=UPI002F953F6D